MRDVYVVELHVENGARFQLPINLFQYKAKTARSVGGKSKGDKTGKKYVVQDSWADLDVVDSFSETIAITGTSERNSNPKSESLRESLNNELGEEDWLWRYSF